MEANIFIFQPTIRLQMVLNHSKISFIDCRLNIFEKNIAIEGKRWQCKIWLHNTQSNVEKLT